MQKLNVKRINALFTLIEMLVVIVIISILASMLLPTLKNSLAAARSTLCKNNMSQTAIAWQSWIGDNNNRIPPMRTSGSIAIKRGVTCPVINDLVPSNPSTQGVNWVVLLQPYLMLENFGGTSGSDTCYWTFSQGDGRGILICPSSPISILYLGNVQTGMNTWNIGGGEAYGATAVRNISDIYSPSKKVAFADTRRYDWSNSEWGDYSFASSELAGHLDFTRHNGFTNTIMTDTSVKQFKQDEFIADVCSDWWKSEAWGFGRQRGSSW